MIIDYWRQSVLDFYLIFANIICSLSSIVQRCGERVPKAAIGKGLFLKPRSPRVEKLGTYGAGL